MDAIQTYEAASAMAFADLRTLAAAADVALPEMGCGAPSIPVSLWA